MFENDWMRTGFFAVSVFVGVAGLVHLSGFFPSDMRSGAARGRLAAGLIYLDGALVLALLALAVRLAIQHIALPWAIIAAGLAILLAPLVVQALPPPVRDGRTGLVGLFVLAGVCIMLLAGAGPPGQFADTSCLAPSRLVPCDAEGHRHTLKSPTGKSPTGESSHA